MQKSSGFFLLLVLQALGSSSHCPNSSRSREQEAWGLHPIGFSIRRTDPGQRNVRNGWEESHRKQPVQVPNKIYIKKGILGEKKKHQVSVEIISRNYFTFNSLRLSETWYRNVSLFPKFQFSLLWKKSLLQSLINLSQSSINLLKYPNRSKLAF